MTEFSFRDMEKCAAREVAMRRNVFRKRGMTPDREREIALMEAIAAHFKGLADNGELAGAEPQGILFIEPRQGAGSMRPSHAKDQS